MGGQRLETEHCEQQTHERPRLREVKALERSRGYTANPASVPSHGPAERIFSATLYFSIDSSQQLDATFNTKGVGTSHCNRPRVRP